MAAPRIDLYDTTLRDGTQGEGFNLSAADKEAVARKLDELGFDYVEGGFPISNDKDAAFFGQMAAKPLAASKFAAFGMTRRRGTNVADDPGVKALLAAGTPVITIVGKSSRYQVETVLSVDAAENRLMIGETVAHLVAEGREVVYDAEHFFDAYAEDADHALATLAAAKEAGASVLCLCDTNGGTMPGQVHEATQAVVEKLGSPRTAIGIHTHNDAGLAVANALAAVDAGARHVQGTVNGVGERCGNMDLVVAAANLRLKLGRDVLSEGSVGRLTELSRFVYETANQPLPGGQPYVGRSAFAHKGGMHVHAILKNPRTYEHIDPAAVGNSRRVLVSELSGVSNIAERFAKKFGVTDRDVQRRVLEEVQRRENEGYVFESAEGSMELLFRRHIDQRRAYFCLAHYRCIIERPGPDPIAEAAVKLHIGDACEHTVSEGDGPVDALDAALRKALVPHYPQLTSLHLADYKVRVVNSDAATAAKVRVVIEFRRDGGSRFGTVGVDENIINASWEALIDGIEYFLLHEEARDG
jgi:2-isopropylmalate synthase